MADKQKISKIAQEKAEVWRKIYYQKSNYKGERSDIYKKLSDEFGIKGINDDNLKNYLSLVEHEKNF